VVKTLSKLHSEPIRLIKYNSTYSIVFSTDQSGMIEIWDPETFDFPVDSNLAYEYISDTDFLTLIEHETYALSMEFSPDGEKLAILSRDRMMRIFSV
jgi:peptidylprolyl isomerase domain and WD repeat-containing protein 1